MRHHWLILTFCLLLAACGGTASSAAPAPSATPLPVQTATATVPAPTTTVSAASPTPTTASPPATATAVSATVTPVNEPPTATATPAPGTAVNGIPISQIAVLPDAVAANVRAIYAAGQTLGRNPHIFSKMGDSTILKPLLLEKFDEGAYELGAYAYLQPTIDHYADSFARVGLTSREALHSWSVFDPMWANKEWCEPNETMIACEFRLNNPSLLIVRLGSNDAGSPDGFEKNLRQVIKFSLENGVIPVLGTKADRFEGAGNVNNEIIRRLAAEYALPLWEYDQVAATLPGRGLGEDQIHMEPVPGPHDYTRPATFDQGHAVQDLTALITLHAIREALAGD